MTRDDLIKKMHEAYRRNPKLGETWDSEFGISSALDVAVEELLKPATSGYSNEVIAINHELDDRRSRYLKTKSDPAVEAVAVVLREHTGRMGLIPIVAKEIVAAVRTADKERK